MRNSGERGMWRMSCQGTQGQNFANVFPKCKEKKYVKSSEFGQDLLAYIYIYIYI